MRQLVLVALAFGLASVTTAHARQGEAPVSQQRKLTLDAPVHGLAMRKAADLFAEDDRRPAGAPLRYAQPLPIAIDAGEDGRWHRLDDGSWLWVVQLSVPGATDLNLGLTRYRLPPGAQLHLIGAKGYYEGPYTHEDNRKHGQLWLPVVPGPVARLELHVPDREDALELVVGQVGAGYRDLFRQGLGKSGDPAKQGSCNIDVACSAADAWRSEVRSVARYSINGSGLCTGTLVMDTQASFKPLLLTANHCGIDATNDASIVAYWNFESPTCGQLSGGSLAQNQTGAIFRAARADVDVALVELEETPLAEFGVHYAGWDRGTAAPAGSVGIHHPNGDEKAISFNDDALTTINSCIGTGGSNTHWRVDNWEQGTTEPGSSGSALFNPSTHRVVGFLSGGSAACNNTAGQDCYGKVSVAWDGASAGTRLKDWLDPGNTGASVVDGADPAASAIVTGSRFVDGCGGAAGNGVAQPGETLDLFVTLKTSGAVSGMSATLDSTDPSVTIVAGTASWPTLGAGQSAENTAPFRLRLAPTATCPADLGLTLAITGTGLEPQQRNVALALGGSGAGEAPLPIPDGNLTGVASGVTVAHAGPLTNLAVRVDISHTYVGDLKISLRHPDGTTAVLLDRPGVPASGYGCDDDNLSVRFADGGPSLENHCADTTPWFSGNAGPVNPLSTLASRPSAAGEWQLIVSDAEALDAGTLQSWELIADEIEQCEACLGAPTILFSGVDAANANTTPDTATFVRAADGSVASAYVREGVGGALVRRVIFDAALDPVALRAVPSTGGTAAQELALLGNAAGDGVIETRDAGSGALLARQALPGTDARDLVVFRNAASQLVYGALVERTSDARGQLRFIAPGGAALATIALEDGFDGTALALLAPPSPGTNPRIAVVGQLDGRPRVAIYQFNNPNPLRRFFAQATGYEARGIVAAGTGGSSVAVLAYSAVAGRASVQTRTTADGALGATIMLPVGQSPLGLFNGGNVDGAGGEELAIVMLRADGRTQLRVHDSATAARLLSRLFAIGATGRAAAVVGNLGSTVAPDLAIVRQQNDTGALRIEGRDLATGAQTISYPAAPL